MVGMGSGIRDLGKVAKDIVRCICIGLGFVVCVCRVFARVGVQSLANLSS